MSVEDIDTKRLRIEWEKIYNHSNKINSLNYQ